MVIKIEEAKKEGYTPTLRFKDMHKAEYIIVSKDPQFAEPLQGPSQFCKNTGGNWYKFNLQLHEYQFLTDDAEKKKEVFEPAKMVGYFDSDNEYQKDDGTWFQSKGTVLKHMFATPAGVKFKITMVENDKGKKVYNVENLSEVAPSVTPASPTPGVPIEEKVKMLKSAGVAFDAIFATVEKEYDTSEAAVKLIYEGN